MINEGKSRHRNVARILSALTLLFVLVGPPASIAQTADTGQTAIQAALVKWTEDFNAGNAEQACSLFAQDLRYDYRGMAERGYKEMCDGLRRALTDRTKRYAYYLAVKEVLVAGDLAMVRLTWTLTATTPGRRSRGSTASTCSKDSRTACGRSSGSSLTMKPDNEHSVRVI